MQHLLPFSLALCTSTRQHTRNRWCKAMHSLVALILLVATGSAQSAVTQYTNEATYLTALATLGHPVISEGFEDNGVWAASRGSISSPGSAASIITQGLVWQSNLPTNGVGTDNFRGQGTSAYRFFSSPHGNVFDANMQNGCDAASAQGNVPDACWQNDGWTINTAQTNATLFGVGGWYYSASGAAKLTYLLDGVDIISSIANPNNTNRDGHRINTAWTFFGVIDMAGFSKVEIREMAGKAKAAQFVYGDSFNVSLLGVAKLAQTINFTALTGGAIGSSEILNATASSGLTVNFTSATPNSCAVSIINNQPQVDYKTTQPCSIQASQTGNPDYLAAPTKIQTITSSKSNQTIGTIHFTPVTDANINGTATVSATASSGLIVRFSSGNAAVCTVTGSTVTYKAAGNCTVLANQVGNTNYNAAPQVSRIVVVGKNSQAISFTPSTGAIVNGTANLSATATSNLVVSFSSSNTAVCTVTGSAVTYKAVGTCTLLADQSGDANYNAAPQVSGIITVSKINQTISFSALNGGTVGSSELLIASSTSGLPISFTSTTLGSCTISTANNQPQVNYKTTQPCIIEANQLGDTTYSAAPIKTQSVTAQKNDQTINFTPPTGAVVNGTANLNAAATSNLAVNFSTHSAAVCSITGSTVTYKTSGSCTILADQSGDANYNAAPQVSSNITVNAASQTISFTAPTNGTARTSSTLTATSDSQLTVTLASITPTVCTLTNSTRVNYLTTGRCIIEASQAGNNNYKPAKTVTTTIQIGLDNTAPVVTPPADIIADATGLKTTVNLGQASAQDNLDGAINAIADQTGPFAPGIYTITWSATDQEGNVGTATQQLTVRPQVSIATDQVTAEGTTVTIPILLNGAFPQNVTIPFTVSGTATNPADHNLANGTLLITASNLEASISYTTVQDNTIEADETVIITLGTPTNAVLGNRISQTTTIREANLAPKISLSVVQNTVKGRIVSQVNGNVTLTATVSDPNPADTHRYDWSMTDNALVDIDGNAMDTIFVFDPSTTLTTRTYRIEVTVTDSGGLTDTFQQQIRIIASHPTLTHIDTDGDGFFDDDPKEGYGDNNDNGIPNYLDPLDPVGLPTNRMVLNGKQKGGAVLEVAAGLTITLGKTAFASDSQGALLSQNSLPTTDNLTHTSGLFDFGITGLRPGDSVDIVLPLTGVIPSSPIYRILQPNTGWQNFAVDANNRVKSTAGSLGQCPSPGDAAYSTGLTPGHFCVQLTIEDGGPNDTDGVVNGRIEDPSGVATTTPTPIMATPTNNSGGGGSLQIIELLMLALFSLSLAYFRIHQRGFFNRNYST